MMELIRDKIHNNIDISSEPFDSLNKLCENDYVRKDNQDCLVIYDTLIGGFEHCERIVKPQINIFAIFFHQLMKIITGYVLKNNELLGEYKPRKHVLEFNVNRFPYISYMDLLNDFDYESKDYSVDKNDNLSIKKELIYYFSVALKPYSKGLIGILPNVLFNKSLILSLIREGYHVRLLDDFKIKVDYLNVQLNQISECVEKIFNDLGIENSPVPFVALINRHILKRVTESSNIQMKYDVIIAGSMTELVNCYYGALGRIKNIPFISIVHGEGEQLMFDEPFCGYGDRTYPSILFGFGPGPLKNSENPKYINSLYDKPQYSTSNSNFIKKAYNSGQIITIKKLHKMKWMYVPDSLLYHRRWGPFGGNIPSKLYLQWQRSLLTNFNNIIYKRHPKGHSIFRNQSNRDLKNLLVPDGKKIPFTSDNFYNIYSQCDGYIFDHISTGFMVASATNRPIIYFNIGKRNLTKYAEKIVKNRCLWIDVDPASPGNLMDKVESIKNKICINNVTSEFSLDNNNQNLNREQQLLKNIKTLI